MKKAVRIEVIKIISAYAIFSCLWIYFSDTILEKLISDEATYARFSIYKGFFFVVITSILLYQLAIRYFLESRQMKEEIKVKDLNFKGERKVSENRINAALNYSKLLYKTSPVGIATYDTAGEAVSVNETMADMIGSTVWALEQQNFRNLESWKNSGLLEFAEKALSTGEEQRCDVHHSSSFGKDLDLDCTFTPFEYEGEQQLMLMAMDITDRKQSERILQEKETQLQTILQSTGEGILAVDEHGKILHTNHQFRELWKIPPELIESGNDQALLEFVLDQLISPGAFLKKVQELYGSFAEDMDTVLFKDGRIFERYSSPIILHDSVSGRVWSFRDVTERRRIEMDFHNAKLQYDNLVTRINVGIYLLHSYPDESFVLDYVSPRMSEILGCSEEKLLADASVFFQNIHPDDQEQFVQLNIEGIRLTRPFNWTVRYLDHGVVNWLRFESFPEKLSNGEVLWHGVIFDVTEAKQAELYSEMGREILQILNESETLENTVQRVIHEMKERTGFNAVGIRLQEGDDYPYFAHDGFPEDFIQAEISLFGLRTGEGLCAIIGHEDHNTLECTCGLIISGKTDLSIPLFTPGGSFWSNDSSAILDIPLSDDPRIKPRNRCIFEGYASFALVPIRKKDQIVGLLQLNDKRKGRFSLHNIEILEGIAAHIGEALMRKRIEGELRKKNAEIEQFLYCVSHELRSPVVTVKTFMGFLEKDLEGNNREQLKQDIHYIHHAADKMKIMLDELLELSRIGNVRSNIITISLNDVLHNVLQTLAGTINTRSAVIKLPDTDIILHGDFSRFCQVWQNLISNALEYTSEGTIPHIRLGVQQINGDTVFSVKDNGIGIEPQYHTKIFGIFEKMNPKSSGIGLGLAMIKKIIENNGGRIWVESEGIGHGSCFCFTLPQAVNQTRPSVMDNNG